MSGITKLFAMFLECLIFLQLLEFSISITCANQPCQNFGECLQRGSSFECLCPCNYTGKICEFRNWCPNATFYKVGCFVNQAGKEELFNLKNSHSSTPDPEWNWYLEDVTCKCALAAKRKGFRFFSVGEHGLCSGFNEKRFSDTEKRHDECQGKTPNRNHCNDNDTFVACVGSSNHEYVYELSEIDQQHCAISEIRNCSDYDYIVRFRRDDPKTLFGPIPNGLPAGKSFSFCSWQRLVFIPSQKYFTVSYSINGKPDHFGLGIEAVDETTTAIKIEINDKGPEERFTSPEVFGKWIHLCVTMNFALNDKQGITYIDGDEFVRLGRSGWSVLKPNGKLFIGHDQDSFGGSFTAREAFVGDITQLNVWDYILNENEINEIFKGVGTETGNFLAWIDLKKFLDGPVDIKGSPVMKWTGKGCKWENWKCDDLGLCQGAIFRCPCDDSAIAPRSCFSSKIYETKPCSDHDYFLEFPSTKSSLNYLAFPNVIHRTTTMSVCTWFKVPPGYTDHHTVFIYISNGSPELHFYLLEDQNSYEIHHSDRKQWARTETYADNQWHHVCVVRNKLGEITLYHGGTSLGTLTFAKDFISGDGELRIGELEGSRSYGFPGCLGHFNVWDIELSEATVASSAGGARTQVGNILGWPAVKQSIVGNIKVFSTSPVMKWTGLNCIWSDNTCTSEQLCEGAKFNCPAVEVNAVTSPHSCADFSFIPIQKMKTSNWKDVVVNVDLVSRGKLHGLSEELTYSSIFLNDVERKFGSRGMNFLVLNARTGEAGRTYECDTHGRSECGLEISKYIYGLPDEVIVLMIVWDSANRHYHDAIPAFQTVVGNTVDITNDLQEREAWALIGYKGILDVSWRSSKISGETQSPTFTRKTIPLLRESCMDHLYMGERKDGVYVIYPKDGPEITVFCDLTTNGGGWTVIQRRHEMKIPFARNWEQYRDGFGPVDSEFWLGNENIHRLGKGQLLTRLTTGRNYSTYSLYNQFNVNPSFSLIAQDHSGLISDGIFKMSRHEENPFFSYDNVSRTGVNCVKKSDGGWWFGGDCDAINLNGEAGNKCDAPFLSSEMMMRPRAPSHDIIIKSVQNTITYKEAMDVCWEDKMILCTSSEICRDGTTPHGGVIDGDHWVPISDNYNDWIQVGNDPHRSCLKHSEYSLPAWGITNDAVSYRGKLFCCPVISEGSGIVFKQGLPNTMTYEYGMEYCWKDKRRLCSSVEICPVSPSRKVPVGGVINGDHWVPVSDKYNEWIQIGQQPNSPCTIHSERFNFPSWGTNGAANPIKGKIFCCTFIPEVPHGLIIKTELPGTMTYEDGMEVCLKENRRLCSSGEVCAGGSVPLGGVLDGDKWAPVSNSYNEWVQIGFLPTKHNPCITHNENYGIPGWGTDGTNPWLKGNVFCCAKILEGRVQRSWKYELKFHGNESHVRFTRITPLQMFSICWWMMINSFFDDWKTVFSHWNLNTTKQHFEFSLNSNGGYQLTIGEDKRESKFLPFVDRNEYHHVCVTWNGSSGSAKVYRDGSLSGLFQNFNTHGLLSDGSMIIGQTFEDSSKFNPKRSFVGIITRFNVWDRELEADVIRDHSMVCGEEEGSIIAWPEVKLWISDGVEIVEGDACFPTNCLDYVYRDKKDDGVYQIKLNGITFSVYCDQKTAGGGWTVIGKRSNGGVAFQEKLWEDYKRGFGSLEGEFWLGHEKIHLLTTTRTVQMLVSGDDENEDFIVNYQRFLLGGEDGGYRMFFSDAEPFNIGQFEYKSAFVTRDKDSDHNCAADHGPYWHKDDQSCLKSNLFGEWENGGNKGAQWFGKDNGELRSMEMKTRPTEEFKRALPVHYQSLSNLSWSSARDFCQRKKSDLCSSTDICLSGYLGKYPFGDTKSGEQKVPVSDKYGLFVNIGSSSTCFTEDLGKAGTEPISKPYKGHVLCCRGFPKRDWRFDLRFGTTGYINIERMPRMGKCAVCWWMRLSPFDQEWATVFSYLSNNKVKMQFSYQGNGHVKVTLGSESREADIPSMTDGNWHQYCLSKWHGAMGFYFDGITFAILPSPSEWTSIIDYGKVVIGQDIDDNGDVVTGLGMVGELSRFNWWDRNILSWEMKEMFQRCGTEVGEFLAWPQLKYWIVGDVEILEGTTCIKPDKHFWSLTEVNAQHVYRDVFNEYNAEVVPESATFISGEAFTLGRNAPHFSQVKLPDDCITDPGMCLQTGLTIAMWVKRKGLASNILTELDKNHETLLKWLDETTSGVSGWLPCYSAAGTDMNVTRFHSGCDYRGPTVTLVKVNDYIFGGFSSENWGGPSRFIPSHSSFLFSLNNPDSTGPVKVNVIDEFNQTALFTSNVTGPTFGDGFDLKIGPYDPQTGSCCSSVLGQTYDVPSDYVRGTNRAKYFFTSRERFLVDELEVFYAYVPSESVGIEDPNLIKDSQMTASSFIRDSENAPHFARLNSAQTWRTMLNDPSPWLQVNLAAVMNIKKIATQGCTTIWVKKFKLSFSMDGITWISYKENRTQKTFVANSDGSTVVINSFENLVEARYARVYPVEQEGNHACMRIELYSLEKVCQAPNAGAGVPCPKFVSGTSVSFSECENAGCCYVNVSSQCLSKQDSLQAVGMESKVVPDENIIASSWVGHQAPYFARLNLQFRGWVPVASDLQRWLQIELNKEETLTHVATQGNTPDINYQYCKSYMLRYRKSDGTFIVYEENGKARIFHGYSDPSKIVKNMFLKPFRTRFVKIYPQKKPDDPVGILRVELYRSLNDFGTTIISTDVDAIGGTGISFSHRNLSQYWLTVKSDSRAWELLIDRIPYHWTHFTFTWHKNWGIQHFENGILKSELRSPSAHTEIIFKSSSSLNIGKSHSLAEDEIMAQVLTIMDLFVVKRQLLPSEIKSFIHEVPCSFGTEPRCTWDEDKWSDTVFPTPSNGTGPEQGLKIKEPFNVAFLCRTSQSSTKTEGSVSFSSSLGVDGKTNEYLGSPDQVCASTQSGATSWWQVDLGGPRNVDVVLLFQEEDRDPHRVIRYHVSVSESNAPGSNSVMCTEINREQEARTYLCNGTQLVQYVLITTTNISVPLSICEVAVYSLTSDQYMFLESSYPSRKGSTGRLTSKYITSGYNCIHFHYHMHGSNMGRLNVIALGPKNNESTLLWRLVGEQGDEWKPATVKLDSKYMADVYKISFEGVVGDGYLSDIAVDNVSLTLDAQCYTSPPAARLTYTAIPSIHKCYCISKRQSSTNANGWISSYHYLIISSNCHESSSQFEWLPNGILQQQEKCLRPMIGSVDEGTQLILSDSCVQSDVAFRLTPTGAIQHRKSLLCIQPARWVEVNENDQLVLGSKGCDYVHWSFVRRLVKGPHDAGYSKQTVIKMGIDDTVACFDDEESLVPYIPVDLQMGQPGTRLLAFDVNSGKFLPATVLRVNETDKHFHVSFDGSGNASIEHEDVSLMPIQPLKGSSILGSITYYTSLLAKWMATSGFFSEFWKPCVYRTENGVSNFTCALNANLPTLVVIRKDLNIIGGFINRGKEGKQRTGNFLFSLRGGSTSSPLKFDGVGITSMASVPVLTYSGIAFGENHEELSLNWTGAPRVISRPGKFFNVTNISLMTGENVFTATDFEVLQPHDEVCLPRCKPNEVCDEVTGKCSCDYSGRPPAWCFTGAANETIYADADHYWSMDSSYNFIDHKAKHVSWGRVEGEVALSKGVNHMSVELKNDDGEIELLNGHPCFVRARTCSNHGITISFWFKSIEQEDSAIERRVFFQTGTVDQHTGFYMVQGDTAGDIIFQLRKAGQLCSYNVHVEPNLWSFITVTFQKVEDLQVFRNGINVTPRQKCVSFQSDPNHNGKFVLGNGGNHCSALFDDVAIWYRRLSDEDIERTYSYYYKDPSRLLTKFEANFPDLSWTDDLYDKENQSYIELEERVVNTFGSLFVEHQNTSFVSIEECRNEVSVVCKINLNLNGSDYEMVEFLEKEDVIENVILSSITTDNVYYEPTVISASSSETSKIGVEWNLNIETLYQGFVIKYWSNKTNETLNVTENSHQSFFNITNLTGFTYYEIQFAAYTLVGLGKWSKPLTVLTPEDVPKYAPGNVTGRNVSSTELAFQWSAVPEENTYQSVRGYVVYVTETKNPSVVVKNITTSASTLSINIDGLRKFTPYTVYIKAFTVDVGIKSLTVNVTTAEDAPDAPPTNLTAFNSSSTSLRIQFKPVPEGLLNGILRGYRVFYFKTREGNHTRKNFTIVKGQDNRRMRRKRAVDEYDEDFPLFASIYGLEEYTNYTIQIQAFTVSDGVLTPPFTTLTGEDLPNAPPPDFAARNTSSTSILLEWELIPEADRNGIIIGYVVYYNKTGGNETRFVHRSTSLSVEIQGLEKFTIYRFELTAFNSIGESNRSAIVYCKTDQDRPDAPPQDITGIPTSQISMGIVWKPVPYPLRHGIILGYRFVFSTMSGEVLVSKTFAADLGFISVSDLMLFTNYTVNMTAFTIKGDGPWKSEVVLSLQLAPDIAPLNLSAESYIGLSSIPTSWTAIPPEKTQGYIIGYRIYLKLVSVGLEDVPDAKEEVVVVNGAYRSSHVLEGLEYFAKYRIYLVAYTVGGDSPQSNAIYAETCRCYPTLSTQWSNMAPYTNITKPQVLNMKTLKQSWGIFPYIVNDGVQFCCRSCAAHGTSTVDFTRNEHGQPSEVMGNGELMRSIDGSTDLTFPAYGYLEMTLFHSQYKYTPLVESPGSAFVVRKEKSSISGILMSNIMGTWSLLVMMICLALLAGTIIWILEQSTNPDEFPPTTIKGLANGFWWAFVSMTTVGYGDRSPRSIPGRVFAIIWTLVGLVITGIMVGDLAASLTLSVSESEKMIYGAEVGAIDGSPEFRLGIRLNAKMNTARSYSSLDDLQNALLIGEVDGILLDAYVVGSRKDLFDNPNLLVNRIKDYRSAYGIIWAGKSSRMRVCLDWYMKKSKGLIFRHIAENLNTAAKIDQIDVSEEMANVFDPTTKIFTQTVFLCLILIGVGVVLGLIYEFIRRRRKACKIKAEGIIDWEEKKLQIGELSQFPLNLLAELTDQMEVLKAKHLKQLKLLTVKGIFKGSKVFRNSKVHCNP